jgi:hypothetical protein
LWLGRHKRDVKPPGRHNVLRKREKLVSSAGRTGSTVRG